MNHQELNSTPNFYEVTPDMTADGAQLRRNVGDTGWVPGPPVKADPKDKGPGRRQFWRTFSYRQSILTAMVEELTDDRWSAIVSAGGPQGQQLGIFNGEDALQNAMNAAHSVVAGILQ